MFRCVLTPKPLRTIYFGVRTRRNIRGGALSYQIQCGRQGFRLTLFNVGTSGEVHILFPNEHHKDNLVKAGTTYRIPDEGAKYLFKAQGPAGEDMVKAIATLEKVALVSESDVKPAGDFQEVTRPEKDIVIAIQETLKPLDSKRWAEAEKVVKVTE